MKHQDALKLTSRDLYEDTRVFTYLVQDMKDKVAIATRGHHMLQQQDTVHSLASAVLQDLEEVHIAIRIFHKNIKHMSSTSLSNIYTAKQQIVTSLHRVAGFVGQVVTMSHWQSPAADQSHIDNVGSMRGKILAHFNDYTRDMHVLGTKFEKVYRDEYIPIPHTVPVFTFATSSGMAAMTTAALFVQGETPEGNILMGTSCYFETKQLLKKLFGTRICEIDLSIKIEAERAFAKFSPVAIFADSIGNEPQMRIIDISTLITLAAKQSHKNTFIIADSSVNTINTTYIHGFTIPKGVTLIGVESQNKLLQFGLDRVTAGVVWGTGYISQKLYDYRDHAGTNCSDSTIATLPTPNRAIAKLYTQRLERNAHVLTSILRSNQKVVSKKVVVTYSPSRSTRSPYLILYWKQSLFHTYKQFIKTVMSEAKKSSFALVYGTSFGLTTTRIYEVAKHTLYERPFLRIAAGSETFEQIEALGEFFSKYL